MINAQEKRVVTVVAKIVTVMKKTNVNVAINVLVNQDATVVVQTAIVMINNDHDVFCLNFNSKYFNNLIVISLNVYF